MKLKSTFAHTALAALMLAGITQAALADQLDDIKKAGTIRVAIAIGTPLFSYTDANMQPTGSDVDTATELAKDLGVKLEIVPITTAARIPTLQAQRADVVISALSITEERAKAVTFADPHYCSGGVIVAKTDAIRSAKDLAGKVVAVQTGTTYLDNVKKVRDVKDVKNFPQDNNARAALMTGRVDAWVVDKFVAKAANQTDPKSGLKIGDFLFIERIAPAVAKGNTGLAQALSQALAAIQADGSYAKISQRWFKEDIRCK